MEKFKKIIKNIFSVLSVIIKVVVQLIAKAQEKNPLRKSKKGQKTNNRKKVI